MNEIPLALNEFCTCFRKCEKNSALKHFSKESELRVSLKKKETVQISFHTFACQKTNMVPRTKLMKSILIERADEEITMLFQSVPLYRRFF